MDGLTGNELAQCLSAVQINITWWEERTAQSGFSRNEIKKLSALNTKLSAMLDEAFPANDDSGGDNLLLQYCSGL